MWIIVVLCALVLGGALQLGVLYGFGSRRPIGDEVEYLDRARAADPYAPDPFLRLPGLIFLNRVLGSESRVRGALTALAVSTVALVALSAWPAGGGPVALLAVLLLLAPERLMHACHIWPDTLLAAAMAGVLLVLRMPDATGPAAMLVLGMLAMIGTMTRVDFLPVAPASGLALTLGGVTLASHDWILLLAPTVLAIALWTWRNWLRYRRPVFEDTWAFNAMVAAELAVSPAQQEPEIEEPIADVHRRWEKMSGRQRTRAAFEALGVMLKRPLETSAAMGRRLLAYVGPETFIVQNVLPSETAYSELSQTAARRLEPLLRLGFPLMVVLCVLGSLVLGEAPPSYVWPAAGVALASVLVHTRTRYRIVIMPIMALWAAEATVGSASVLAREPVSWIILVLAAGLGWALLLGSPPAGRNPLAADLRSSQARVAELTEQLEERRRRVRKLEAERDPDAPTILELRNELDEQLQTVRKLEAERDWKSRELLELQSELERRSEWVLKLEAENESHSQKFLDLQGESDARAKQIERLEAAMESNRLKLLELEVELDGRLDAIRQLEAERDANRQTILELQGELEELLERLRRLEDEGESKGPKVVEL